MRKENSSRNQKGKCEYIDNYLFQIRRLNRGPDSITTHGASTYTQSSVRDAGGERAKKGIALISNVER